jgi:hypothetical protein
MYIKQYAADRTKLHEFLEREAHLLFLSLQWDDRPRVDRLRKEVGSVTQFSSILSQRFYGTYRRGFCRSLRSSSAIFSPHAGAVPVGTTLRPIVPLLIGSVFSLQLI